jgi:integrase
MGRGTGVRAASKRSIQITFEYKGQRCEERVRREPTAANLAWALRHKGAVENAISAGSFDYAVFFPESKRARKFAVNPAQTIRVGELLNEWLRAVGKELEPETYGDYAEYVQNVWKPAFGSLWLADLTAHRVYTWVSKQTTSRKRILNLLTPLRQAVRYAVSPRQLLKVDPLAGLKVKRPDGLADEKDVIDPFSHQEIAAILPHLRPEQANMILFWVWTGLRVGELVALTWNDIDLTRGVAIINKAARGHRRKAPKTRAGRREVTLLPMALEALKRQKPITRLLHKEIFLHPGTPISFRARRGVGCGGGAELAAEVIHTGRLRPTTMNKPYGSDKPIRTFWRAACEAAGVKYRFPRQLRHTYASWMLRAREDAGWVSKQMGHRDVAVTLQKYVKFIPGMNEGAGSKAAAAWQEDA